MTFRRIRCNLLRCSMYGIFTGYSIHGAYDNMGYIISSLLLIIVFHASPKKMSDKIQPKTSLHEDPRCHVPSKPSLPAMCRAGKSVTGSKAVKRRKNIFRTKRSNSKEAYLNLRPLFWVSEVGFIGGELLNERLMFSSKNWRGPNPNGPLRKLRWSY